MTTTKKNMMQEPLDIPEDQIPWYRWRWVYLVAFFFFFPAMLLIALTGSVYGKQDGVVFKFSRVFKYSALFLGFLITINLSLRYLL